jgi:FSR family fosmidomycin resistance protein-like MFS transporter
LALPVLLGIAHCVSDAAAGYLVIGAGLRLPIQQAAALALGYNLLAFGLQPLIGIAIDRWGLARRALPAALLLSSLALIALPGWPAAAILFAGTGSAVIHAAGGGLALAISAGRAREPGIFAAPGVLGLALGGWLAAEQSLAVWLLLVALLILVGVFSWLPKQRLDPAVHPAAGPQGYEWVILALVGAIALRSAVWTSLETGLGELVWSISLLALAASAGKLIGGVLADRLGWFRWAFAALAAAALLLAGSLTNDSTAGQSVLLFGGIFFLQSCTPLMLALLGRWLPHSPATAAGLGLGIATLLGGLPVLAGFSSKLILPLPLILTLAAAFLAIWAALRARVHLQAG